MLRRKFRSFSWATSSGWIKPRVLCSHRFSQKTRQEGLPYLIRKSLQMLETVLFVAFLTFCAFETLLCRQSPQHLCQTIQ